MTSSRDQYPLTDVGPVAIEVRKAASAQRRHGDSAPAAEQATALAVLIELSTALEEPERVPEWGARLRQLTLTTAERRQVESAVADPTLLEPWLPPTASGSEGTTWR